MQFKNALKYSLYIILATAIWVLIMQYLGFYGAARTGMNPLDYFFIFIPLFFLYHGIKVIKNEDPKNWNFKKGVKEGFFISVVSGIGTAIFFWIFHHYINTFTIDFARREYGLPTTISAEQVIWFDVGLQLASSIIGGVIFSVIITAFLNRKKESKK